MSSSFLRAACATALAFSVVACNTGPAQPDKKKTAARIRYHLDTQRNRVWLLTSEGAAIYEAKAPDHVTRVPLPGWLIAREPYACLPDLALGPNGEAVISSNVVPVLWRVDPETLAVTRHELRLDADTDKDIGFTALTYSAEQEAFLGVSGAHGTVWRIDAQLRRAHRTVRRVPRETNCGARAPA